MKAAAVHFTRSTRIKAYFGSFNSWIPCSVQYRAKPKGLKDGYVFVDFHGPAKWDKFRLQLPIDAIKVEHKLFRHWVPLRALDLMLAVLRQHEQASRAWYWTEMCKENV